MPKLQEAIRNAKINERGRDLARSTDAELKQFLRSTSINDQIGRTAAKRALRARKVRAEDC